MFTRQKETVKQRKGGRTEESVPPKRKHSKLPLFVLLAIAMFGIATAMLFSTTFFTEASFGINPFNWHEHWNIYLDAVETQASGNVIISEDGSELEFTAKVVDFTAFDIYGKLTLPVEFKIVNDGLQDALVSFDCKIIDSKKSNTNILESVVITKVSSSRTVLKYAREAGGDNLKANHVHDTFVVAGESEQRMILAVTLRLTQGMELTESNNSIKFTIPFEAVQVP